MTQQPYPPRHCAGAYLSPVLHHRASRFRAAGIEWEQAPPLSSAHQAARRMRGGTRYVAH